MRLASRVCMRGIHMCGERVRCTSNYSASSVWRCVDGARPAAVGKCVAMRGLECGRDRDAD